MSERRKLIRLLSFSDDQPNERLGVLIPRDVLHSEITRAPVRPSVLAVVVRSVLYITVPAMAVLVAVIVSTTGYGLLASDQYALAPAITIVDPEAGVRAQLPYGPHAALMQPNFFTQTRDAFVEEGFTFIEVDIASAELRYFEDGVLLVSAEILTVGEAGSWWDTPAGLYTTEKIEERPFSSLGQVYLPHRVTFQGNYMIHGEPEFPSGTLVERDFSVGGIRIETEAAARLAKHVEAGTPVLVHDVIKSVDEFVYEPAAPEVGAKHYLIADIENGTVLAASDMSVAAPIASVTKLMTAVVASEELDLDSRIWVTAPSFVQSLVPRLSDRSSVSLYSLMQLLLVESSNEASEVIASELGREEFMSAMNARARSIGMLNSFFDDPSGLSSNNVSSLGDLFLLTKYIFDHKQFILEITANEQVVNAKRGGDFGGLINFNEIEDIENFVGGKVGETMAAGQTSVSLHEIEVQGTTRTVAVILMGSEGRTADVKALLKYAETQFRR